MSECQCEGPGWCAARGCQVSAIAHRVCQRGDERSIRRYFEPKLAEPKAEPLPESESTDWRSLIPMGARLTKATAKWIAAGRPLTTEEEYRERLGICQGDANHSRCPVYDAAKGKCGDCGCGLKKGVGPIPAKTRMATENCPRGKWPVVWPRKKEDLNVAEALPVKMVVPSEKRPGVWRGGVLQIMVTRSCDLACHSCTAGSNLVSKPAVMTPDQFERAVKSLDGYFGVVGVFGGNPTTSRHFEDYCRILRAHVPYERRGIWTNNPMGKGALCRITFNPAVSNINVHLNDEAYREFERDWPEALSARAKHTHAGLVEDAVHGSPWISLKDLDSLPFPDGSDRENTESNRWDLIKDCTINKSWSAMVCLVRGELRAFACEIMGHMAALHGDNPNWDLSGQPMPDIGLKVEPGWWRKSLEEFGDQFRTCCHNCAVPLNRPGQLAIGGEREEFSERHRFIARPKVKGRAVQFISSESLAKRDRPAIEYISGAAPAYCSQ